MRRQFSKCKKKLNGKCSTGVRLLKFSAPHRSRLFGCLSVLNIAIIFLNSQIFHLRCSHIFILLLYPIRIQVTVTDFIVPTQSAKEKAGEPGTKLLLDRGRKEALIVSLHGPCDFSCRTGNPCFSEVVFGIGSYRSSQYPLEK